MRKQESVQSKTELEKMSNNTTRFSEIFTSLLSRTSHSTVLTAAFLLLVLCVVLLFLYAHVLKCMVKAQMYKQAFYLQLLQLGVHEIGNLILYIFYLTSTIFSVSGVISLGVDVYLVLGGVHFFLFCVAIWLILEMAILRVVAVFLPLTANRIFGPKTILIIMFLGYFYGGFALYCFWLNWRVFLVQHIILLPVFSPDQVNENPTFVLILQGGPILGCVIMYLVSALRLAYISLQERVKKRNRVGQASADQPTGTGVPQGATQGSQEGSTNRNDLRNDNKRKAQWTLLKIAATLFVLYLLNFILGPLIHIYDGDYRVAYLQMLLEILIAGVNPILYVMTSSAIREVTPIPKMPCLKGINPSPQAAVEWTRRSTPRVQITLH